MTNPLIISNVFYQAFWDWSWDELVAYDLPASFQYVHDQTGLKLHYVGHSLVNMFEFILYFFSGFRRSVMGTLSLEILCRVH